MIFVAPCYMVPPALMPKSNVLPIDAVSPENRKIFEKIFELIRALTGADISGYKNTTVNRRIQRQMRLHKIERLSDFSDYLSRHPDAVKALYDDIFIHVTEFFRDPESFEVMKSQLFPKLVKDRIGDVPIRVWVPGCSTGEEAYSLAILLHEFLDESREAIAFQIFATDISDQAIERARIGAYSEADLKGLSDIRLKKYFDKSKEGYKIKKSIRDCCVFSRHDLTGNPPLAKMNLISCRNVLIYFDNNLQKQVLPIFHYSLITNGYLWLGRSESPTGISRFFVPVDKVHKVFRKNGGSVPAGFRFPLNRPIDKLEIKKAPNHFAAALDQNKEIDRIAFARYAPSGVVINTDLEIVQVRGHTAPFLELPAGQVSNNLLKMLRPELLPGVRIAIKSAMRQNVPCRKEGLTYAHEKGRKKVDIEVIPVNPQVSSHERQYIVFFEEPPGLKKQPAQTPKKKSKKKTTDSTDSKDAYIAELLQDLDSMREYQQSLSEGFEAAQEELTSSNEELHSTLEEFQSTNEELEAAKEEMQASNEELATVNDELQARNDELAKSEERFRLLVDAVKDYAIFMLDPQGNIASWNEGARRLKGYERSEVIGTNFSRFYTPEDVQRGHPQNELEIARKVGRYEEEGWRVRKDGSRFWANVVISRIDDSNENILGFSKVTRDLTERKRAEEDLREANESLEMRIRERTWDLQSSEERLKQFIERSPYAVAMLDNQMRYIFASQRWLKDFRLPQENLRGKSHYEIFPETPERWREIHRRCLRGATERSDGERFERPDGAVEWSRWEIRPWYDRDGDVGGILLFMENITERLRSEAQLQVISNTIPAFITYIDRDERYRFANSAYLTWVGKTSQEIIGKTAREVVGDEVYKRIHPEMVRALHGEPVAYDLQWRDANGGPERIFRIRYVPDLSPEKMVNGYVMHGQDVTDLRKAIVSRDEFLTIASHELKTPLTSLKLQLQMSELLMKPAEMPEALKTHLQSAFSLALRQINSMAALVEDLLDITRIQSGRFEISLNHFDFSELVREVASRLEQPAKSAKSNLELNLDNGLFGNWDRHRMEQVLTNLVSNAIKHAPGSSIRISAMLTGTRLRLVVEDSGAGIPEDKLAKIFDRFERAAASKNISGMGLGLYIVKKIVDVHEGSIKVESQPQKGSKFTIEIPTTLKAEDLAHERG